MSNAVFPSLPGLSWGVTKQPQWATKIQRSVSGRELRAAFMSAPLYEFGMSYEVLREALSYQELQTLIGFFNSRKGSFDSFLYRDPSDNSVTAQPFGAGDGVTKTFQLVRTYGGDTEPVMNLNGAPAIYKDEAIQSSGYSIDTAGSVTFTAAPAIGAVLAWAGAYYYRCRFSDDVLDFENVLSKLWSARKVSFVGCLGNKI